MQFNTQALTRVCIVKLSSPIRCLGVHVCATFSFFLRRRRLDSCQAVWPPGLFKMPNIRALGQKVFSPSTSPASHLSHRSSDMHFWHRLRTSLMMASVSPRVAISGSTPARFNIPNRRRSDLALQCFRNHARRAKITATMAIATPIWNRVEFMT